MPVKKSYRLLIIFLLIIGIILAIIFLSLRAKFAPAPKFELAEDFFTNTTTEEKTTFRDARYNGPSLSTPTELPILAISSQDVAAGLYQKLNQFCQIEENQDIYFYGHLCDYSQYENGKSPQVLWIDQQFTDATINIQQADVLVKQYLSNVWPNPYEISLVDYSYFHGHGELEPAAPNKANQAWMFYAPSFNDIPIVTHNILDYIFSFIVNSNNQVLKAELKTTQLNHQSEETLYPLISLNQAIRQINQGQAYVGYVYDEYEQDPPLSSFSKLQFDKVVLQYRIYKDNTRAIPAYVFTGMGVAADKQEVVLEVVTPAINFTIANN